MVFDISCSLNYRDFKCQTSSFYVRFFKELICFNMDLKLIFKNRLFFSWIRMLAGGLMLVC